MKTILVLIAFVATAMAASSPRQLTVLRAGERPTIPGPSANFTGKAVIDRQVRPDDPSRAMGSLVTFEPGARTAWHTHPLGQTLVVTSGCGWVQTKGGEVQEILPGDVVWTPAGVPHWHGAQPHSSMSHYAMIEPLNGRNVEWMERVTDEQYGGGKSRACKQPASALQIQEQGSFMVGGSKITHPGKFDPLKPTPDGQTYSGDHAYVFYQVPVNARKLPLILWHGFGQFSKTWESTPDGREGFQNIFLRRRFSVYVIDQPRRGDASRSMAEATLKPVPDEQNWFGVFRIGIWPNYFPGVQFSRDPKALDQYFRQMAPNIGPFDLEVVTDAGARLLEKTGPAILVTHSQGGGPGWITAIKSPNVRGIVAYEPGSNFVFPEGEVPPPQQSSSGQVEALGIPRANFAKLTRIPIVIYYGDNIPKSPDAHPGQDGWRARLAMARLWRDAVNRHGGDVTVVHLPEIGIRGNTHFPFSDLNNLQIAGLMSTFLASKKLD